VIALIRRSGTVEEAREGLMSTFNLSEIQARAILDMRLQKLTGLERDKVKKDYEETMALIAELKAILESEELQRQIVKDELLEVKEKYGDERRTEITFEDGEINIEDIIADEQVVITISHTGYVKRTPVSEYRTQSRGGRGAHVHRQQSQLPAVFYRTGQVPLDACVPIAGGFQNFGRAFYSKRTVHPFG
jgi:DNA gyrase subunit A